MKRQNIANLYQKQKYAKYELFKESMYWKFALQATNGTREIWHRTIWQQDNLAPSQFGTMTI